MDLLAKPMRDTNVAALSFQSEIELDISSSITEKRRDETSDKGLPNNVENLHRLVTYHQNETVSKSPEFRSIGEEAEHMQTLLQDVFLDIKMLSREVAKLGRMIKTSQVKDDSRVKKFACELQLLKPHVAQSNAEVHDMILKVKNLLYLMDSIPDSSSADTNGDQGEAKIATEQIVWENYGLNSDSLAYYAVQVKLEDNLNISSFINTIQETGENEEEADDASKMMNSELETEVSSEPSSRSPFLNQSFTDFSYIAWPKGMSCGGVLEDVSLQTLSQKKILYTCPFCGIQTKDCNRHIEQKHSGVKEFRCGECKTIFGDFEALWHHLVFSKQGTKELIKLEENGSRKSGEIRKYGQLVECDICGQECMGQANLKKHFACTHPDKKPFGCHVCGKRFLSKVGSQICNHLERVRKKHICRTCGITFCSEDELRLHNEQPHILPTPKIPCFICDEKFLHHKDLYSHIKSIHAGDILKCRICQRHFDEPLSLRKHLMKHNNSPTCEICGKRYMESRSLKLHMRIHQEQVSCHLCGRIFSCASTLKEHMNSHIGEKPYNCDLCHEKFCSSIAVESHKARWHSKNQRSNKCLICGKVFRGSFARNSHHLQAHSEEERTLHNVVVPMFTCNVCGKTVRIEYKLKHLEKHKSKAEKLFVCEICGEGYSSYLKLGLHLIKHKLEKGDEELTKKEQIYLEKHSHSRLASKSKETFASMCHICGKSFRSKSYFSMHQALHSKHFRFECEVCGKKFPWKSYLNTHKMMHLKNKPFACPECGRKFATQSSMQCHIKVQHHKQRRFKCNVCLKAFTTKDCLKVHKRRHTGEKPYTCNLCGRSFADRSTFHKHKACHAKRKLKDMTSVR